MHISGVDLCKKCGWVQTPQSADEMKILNSVVTKQCLLNKPYTHTHTHTHTRLTALCSGLPR